MATACIISIDTSIRHFGFRNEFNTFVTTFLPLQQRYIFTVIVVEIITWVVALGGAITVIAAAQCLQLYVRRRWHARLRLPDPAAYTDAPSFRCDIDIVLHIHSSRPVRIHFRRCGDEQFVNVYSIETGAIWQRPRMDRWRGCDWTASAIVPANALTPGFYQIDVEHQDDASRRWCMCLLVHPMLSQPLVVVAPTNTWNAYNDFGGLSNYRDRATPLPLRPLQTLMRWANVRLRIGDKHWLFAVPLPERRPNSFLHRDLINNGDEIADIRAEAALIRFLEREKNPYMVISDRDFAYDINVSRTRLVIFSTHSEYWADEMIARLGELIERGINILFLSGNNIYRKVQFMESAVSVIDMMIPQREVVPLIGTYSDAYGWRTYAGYRVNDANHWCFAGLGVKEGSEFGMGSAKRPGASGRETDKVRPGSTGFRVVAIGKNAEGPAFMVCRDMPDRRFIFNVSSISFTPCLDDDPVIQGLVRNLIHRGLMATAYSDSGTVVPLAEQRSR
jgi:hypothetical protein